MPPVRRLGRKRQTKRWNPESGDGIRPGTNTSAMTRPQAICFVAKSPRPAPPSSPDALISMLVRSTADNAGGGESEGEGEGGAAEGASEGGGPRTLYSGEGQKRRCPDSVSREFSLRRRDATDRRPAWRAARTKTATRQFSVPWREARSRAREEGGCIEAMGRAPFFIFSGEMGFQADKKSIPHTLEAKECSKVRSGHTAQTFLASVRIHFHRVHPLTFTSDRSAPIRCPSGGVLYSAPYLSFHCWQ